MGDSDGKQVPPTSWPPGGAHYQTNPLLYQKLVGNNLSHFPGGSEVKASASNVGDPGFNSWVRKIPGEGNSNGLQCPCLENLKDREAWQAIIHGVKSRT